MCKHYWVCLHEITTSPENVLPFCSIQHWTCFCSPGQAVNCREQGSLSGHLLAACLDEKVKGVTRFWRIAVVQNLWMWHSQLLWCRRWGQDTLQARNMLMLIYGSSRRGICLLHTQVSHLWAIILTQVWVNAKKTFKTTFFWIAGQGTTNFHGNVTL